jgi:hypothetical protein
VKKRVDFFHNLNFCFQKWFRSGSQRGGDYMNPHGLQFKGVRGLKTERLTLATLKTLIRAYYCFKEGGYV